MGFGQLVIGPPGSGKTTYCNGMAHYFSLTNRPCAVINLDPANHDPPYDADVSVEELITLDDAMREFNLGPNGAMVYCMEYLAKNLDWLRERVAPLVREGRYLLVDCPGQVELQRARRAQDHRHRAHAKSRRKRFVRLASLRRAPRGRALVRGPDQVHRRADAVAVEHAAHGDAARQPVVQG